MKLHEGRSGTQEIACLAAMAAGITGLYGIDSQMLYANGNASYVTIPLAIAASLLLVLLAKGALSANCGVQRGGALIKLAALIQTVMQILGAVLLLSRFTHAVHYHIFSQSRYEQVLIWAVLTIMLITIPGFETISRTARCIAVAFAVLLIATLLLSTGGSKLYRLSPFPSKSLFQMAVEAGQLITFVLPGVMAVMFFPKSANGYSNALRGTLIGALIAALIAFTAQITLGMAYAYTELRDIFMPLYELNMILPNEGYFMRYDKLLLFIWLIGALVVCAFYAYSAGNTLCRISFGSDARPSVIAICALIGAATFFLDKSAWLYEILKAALLWGGVALAAVLACAFIVSKIKSRRSTVEKNA